MRQTFVFASAIALIVVLSVSIVASIHVLQSASDPPFYVGVEFAYSGNLSDLKGLVDQVKNYTNLFVIGSLDITANETVLNQACDYVVGSGLHLIVLFTESTKYNYSIFDWLTNAPQRYGDKFLGLYRFDEPGGNQLDNGPSMSVTNATDYTDAANQFTDNVGVVVKYYLNYSHNVFTSDYGLHWFDYSTGYSAVFGEFGWNNSRPLQIALCRGAAAAHNKDWGTIITWEYDSAPYLESGAQMYQDMVLAYQNGAKYVLAFDYPQIGEYGILTEEHFAALKNFWTYVQSHPNDYGSIKADAAYVLPTDYGFGFRSPADVIWGLWNSDSLSQKVWDDTSLLLAQYNTHLDIVYNDPNYANAIQSSYQELYYWNQTLQ
jgi:hypothetical protein